MRLPLAAFGIVKEAARHLLRRPVVGLACVAWQPDGRLLLIRRGDTGTWALPGGTLEWGETLEQSLSRELREEAGAEVIERGRIVGVYSRPDRDARFHAVTTVVEAKVTVPTRPPMNSLEILEVQAFAVSDIPRVLAFGMRDMVDDALAGRQTLE